MNKPLISIITVCYNSEKTIGGTIESILNQLYTNIEYILVDGSSKDKTLEIIKSYEESFRRKNIKYKWISEPDKGIYDAMNKGIEMASGELIGIINSDDWYELDALNIIVEQIKPEVDLYYGNLKIYKEDIFSHVQIASKNLEKLKKGMIVPHPTVFVRKKVYDIIGKFSLEFKIAADWDFLLRAYLNNLIFLKIDNNIANFRLGGESYIFNKKYILEKSKVRKKNRVFKLFDKYYYFDIIKLLMISEKNLMRINIWKNKYRIFGE